jgi:hypothetical protein
MAPNAKISEKNGAEMERSVCMPRSVHPTTLTKADIKALAASIYEPMPRLWRDEQWRCPQCRRWNADVRERCYCGISRDGLPEFCERPMTTNHSSKGSQVRFPCDLFRELN